MKKEFFSHSDKETMQIALDLGKRSKPGDVICLEGELGAGKTHFVKGFAEAFELHPGIVTSPTFVLINEYHGSIPLYHFDFYRLDNIEQALEIGVEEYLYGEGVCIIEWPEKITSLLPANAVHIHMKITGANRRTIYVCVKTEDERS